MGTAVFDGLFRIWCSHTYLHPKPFSIIEIDNKHYANNLPAGIAILGASRAVHHYVSSLLEDSLHISTYNWGFDGQSILNQYVCFLKAIDNGGLKIVILDLSNSQLADWVDKRISSLYPYYWDNDTIKHLINEVKDSNMDLFMASSLIQFNSRLSSLITSNFIRKNHKKGYIPLPYTGGAAHTDSIVDEKTVIYNPIGIKLNRIAEICHKENIRFVVCFSPMLNSSSNSSASIGNLCRSKGIEFWDMGQDINDPILFSDADHLNEKGASLFTTMIAKKIKNLYPQD